MREDMIYRYLFALNKGLKKDEKKVVAKKKAGAVLAKREGGESKLDSKGEGGVKKGR